MSYMDFPRVHFSGTFEAGPSTINNTSDNYKPGQSPLTLLWNKNGNGYIKLIDCKVTSALTMMTGKEDRDLQGGTVATTDNWGSSGAPCKIVDLDPEQQMVSMFYGLQLKIGVGDNYVIADMTEMWFQNYFFGANATYQSVLTPVEWGENVMGAIKLWKETSPGLLSIRMITGPVLRQRPAQQPNGSTPFICKIVGTIGPADPAEPISFVPARLVRPTQDPMRTNGKYNFAPAKVTMGNSKPVRLTIDLGSSAPRNSQTLTVTVEKAKAMPLKLGTLEFSPAAQDNDALITDFDLSKLTDTEADYLLNGPIVLRDSSGDTLFAESATGIYVDAFPYVFRMEADTSAEVEFWATRFGAPADDVDIVISDETASTLPLGDSVPPRVGVVGPNGSKVSFDPSVTTKGGRAKATINGGDPDNFRQYIDGQVYALSFNTNPPTPGHDPNAFLSLLVHDRFDKAATWENIRPIMKQYAVLYPVMKHLGIDLGHAQSLIENKAGIVRMFGLPFNHPGYMPVVRDLSDAKQAAIMAWLKAQPDS